MVNVDVLPRVRSSMAQDREQAAIMPPVDSPVPMGGRVRQSEPIGVVSRPDAAEGSHMTCLTRRIPALFVLLAVVGLLIAWAGGFVLSSGNSRCLDGVAGGQCSGRYATEEWHTVGAVAVVLGAILMASAVAAAVRSRRRTTQRTP
jgi:hypothetical protein